MDLFDGAKIIGEPLAARMRPRNLSEYIGQDHILGEGKLLRRLIQADRVTSLIFYGPPGTGKTTLASVIANATQSRFVVLNAVLSGVKQLREELEEAAKQQKFYNKRTLLFVDEVHRWNKSQQDALLPWVENGTVVLIGATTENPYFEVNPALVSRSRIFRLKKLDSIAMEKIVFQAIEDSERGYGEYHVTIESDALSHLVKTADGDALNVLNALELAIETTPDHFPPEKGSHINVNLQTAEESIQQKAVLYDKEGDYHYDIISAFIKSIRGSDPDGVLYWLARMIQGGEDSRYIFRRMLISACEDIGLADPNAILVVEGAARAFDRVGLPEGRFMLTQAALYLATAPKSNSNLAFFDAIEVVSKERTKEIPNHLKDNARDSEAFGHGKGYLYPHAYKDHWVAQQYLPGSLQGRIFYNPSNQGYEAKIRDSVLRKREVQLDSVMIDEEAENYSWSPENKKHTQWITRAEKGNDNAIMLRDSIIQAATIKRNQNLLVLEEGSALLYWEALRSAPEGGVYLLTDKIAVREHIEHYFTENEIDDIPLIINGSRSHLMDLRMQVTKNSAIQFDCILARNLLSIQGEPIELLTTLKSMLAKSGKIIFTQKQFLQSTHLSSILTDLNYQNQEAIKLVKEREKTILKNHLVFKWDLKTVTVLAEKMKMRLTTNPVESVKELEMNTQLLEQWFNPNSPDGYATLPEEIIKPISLFLFNKKISWKYIDNIYTLQ